MKVRNGFVSNSSSSSFVVVFRRKPENALAVLQMLFGLDAKEDELVRVYDHELSKHEIATMVWEDIGCQTRSVETKARLIETARRGTDEELENAVTKFLGPEPDWEKPECRDDYQIYHDLKYKLVEGVCLHRAIEKLVKAKHPAEGTASKESRADYWQEENKYHSKLDEFHWAAVMKEIGDNEFYVFEYGDSHGDRQSIVLEHGGIFDRLKHWRFSHH